MPVYSTGEVAEILGVSSDTVRRWCDDGRLGWIDGGGRKRLVEGTELAAYLRDQERAYEPRSVVPQSARNRFTGIVTRVDRDTLVAVVEIYAQAHRLVSMMTREAADELNLQPGALATAVVKSTNVMVELARP